MPLELRNQYKIIDRDMLSILLLSSRTHMKNNEYIAFRTCFRNNITTRRDKLSKVAISIGWAIGKIPSTVIVNKIDEILATMLAKIRVLQMYLAIQVVHMSQSKGTTICSLTIQNLLVVHSTV